MPRGLLEIYPQMINAQIVQISAIRNVAPSKRPLPKSMVVYNGMTKDIVKVLSFIIQRKNGLQSEL